jgi:hypothetical protein
MPSVNHPQRFTVPSGSASAGLSYTPTVGANRVLLVIVHYYDGSEALTALPTPITYGAASLSVLDNHVANTPNDTKQFAQYLIAPANGPAIVTVTKASASHLAEVYVLTLLDTHQTTPFRTPAKAENNFSTGPATVTLTGAQATDISLGLVTAAFGPTLTENQTLVAMYQAPTQNFYDLSVGVQRGNGSDPITMSWALGSGARWRAAAVAVRAPAAGGSGSKPNYRRKQLEQTA